jgi:beta-lactamase regulating signal transducer with metallopeptidase domain
MISTAITAFAARFVFVLVDATVKAVLLLAAAITIVALARRASASFRHLVWAIALACVFFLPLLSLNLPHWRVSVTVPAAHSAKVTNEAPPLDQAAPTTAKAAAAQTASIQAVSVKPPISAYPTDAPAPAQTFTQPSAAAAASHPSTPDVHPSAPNVPWPTLVFLAWVTGAAIMLLQAARGLAGIRSITRGSFLVKAGLLAEAALAAASQMQVGRCVELRQANAAKLIMAPLTFGARQPVVVLPAEADEWPAQRLRAALLHEMAHIKRHDWALQMLGSIAGAAHWFNPLVWMALKRMRGESEAACDDLVLAAGVPAQDYARHLLDVALSVRDNKRLRSSAVAMAQGSKIEGRLRAILTQSLSRRPVTRQAAAGFLIVALLVALPLAALRLVAQEAVVPVPAASGLQLKGDFTLVYAVTDTNQASSAYLFRQYQQLRQSYKQELKKDPYVQPVPDDFYLPFAAYLQRRTQPHHQIITVSSRGGSLFYQTADTDYTYARLYNGRITQTFGDGHSGSTSAGLHIEELTDCVLPAVGLPYVPLLKNATLASASGTRETWNADILSVGVEQGQNQPFYGNGIVHAVNDGGTWKLLDTDNSEQQWQFFQHQRFQGLWIASQMRLTRYGDFDGPPPPQGRFTTLGAFMDWFKTKRKPTETSEYRLLSVSPNPPTPATFVRQALRQSAAASLVSQKKWGLYDQGFYVSEALHLRYHLQDWAEKHKALLLKMSQAPPTDVSAALAVGKSLQSLPTPLWQGESRFSHIRDGDPRTGYVGQKPTFISKPQNTQKGRTTQDFEFARSFNPGTSHVILWASGRITQPSGTLESQQEITPPFFVGTASNLAGEEPQAASVDSAPHAAGPETSTYPAEKIYVASGPSATLANGDKISLVGVTQATKAGTEWDMYGNPWWRSSGTPAPPQTEGMNGHWHWTAARTHNLPPYIFKMAVQPRGGRWRPKADSPISFFEQFPGASEPDNTGVEAHIVTSGPHPVARDIEPSLIDGTVPQFFDGLIGGSQCAELYPPGTRSCIVRCGVAAGPWHIATAFPSPAISSSSKISGIRSAQSTTISLDLNGKPRVTCSDIQGRKSVFYFAGPLGTLSDINWRLTATDSTGRDVPLVQVRRSGEAPGNPLTLIGKANAATWATSLAPVQIKEFQLETRPYETVEFRNVQLQPSLDAGGSQPTAAALLTQASDIQLDQARQLRAHLQSWANGNRAALQQMAQGQPGDLSLVMPVYDSFQRLPAPLWNGDPRVPRGIDTAPFQGMLPSRLTLSHLLRSQGLFERTMRADFKQHRDLEVAQSYNAGQTNMTVWVSGRITQGIGQRELAPAFLRAKN